MRSTGSYLHFAACAALTIGLLAAGGPSAAETIGRIDLFAGQRSLDSDFAPADDADQLGLALTIGREGWPVGIAFDVYRADEDVTEPATFGGLPVSARAEVEIGEIALGVRREMTSGRWSWRYGAGITLVDVEADASIADASGPLFSTEEDDDTYGLWASLGGAWTLGEQFDVGLQLRYTDADVDLGGTEFDAGGVQYGLTLGYRW